MVAAKNPLVRLKHIRDELDALAAVTEGYDRERYVADYVVRRASERALLIISEAVKSLPKDLLVRYPEMAWPEIANLETCSVTSTIWWTTKPFGKFSPEIFPSFRRS
jgi:uncharacterized protein with HEPN domain